MNECTIAVRVNWPGEGDVRQPILSFVSDSNGITLLCSNDLIDTMEVSVDDDSGLETVVISTSGPLETGWQQVAVVFKADALELYLNGELVGSAIPMSLPIELGETTENWLGMSIDPLDNLFQGALDDVRIYNRALSQVEIAELHGLD